MKIKLISKNMLHACWIIARPNGLVTSYIFRMITLKFHLIGKKVFWNFFAQIIFIWKKFVVLYLLFLLWTFSPTRLLAQFFKFTNGLVRFCPSVTLCPSVHLWVVLWLWLCPVVVRHQKAEEKDIHLSSYSSLVDFVPAGKCLYKDNSKGTRK